MAGVKRLRGTAVVGRLGEEEAFYREGYNKLEEGLLALAELSESRGAYLPAFSRDNIEAGLQLVNSARYSLPYGSAYVRLGTLFNKDRLSADTVLVAPPVELP